MGDNREMISKCMFCSESNKVRVYDSINACSSPELKSALLDGSLFAQICPHCGRMNLLRFKLLYHDPALKLMFWLTLGEEELELQARKMFASVPELSDYVTRFVDEPGELIEKVKIFDAGMDDVAMEMCKYVTRMELAEKSKDKAAAIMDAPFKFLKTSGSDHDITLTYPLDSSMEMVELGFNVYEDCAAIVRRNSQLTESLSGFCRVNADWINSHFR